MFKFVAIIFALKRIRIKEHNVPLSKSKYVLRLRFTFAFLHQERVDMLRTQSDRKKEQLGEY